MQWQNRLPWLETRWWMQLPTVYTVIDWYVYLKVGKINYVIPSTHEHFNIFQHECLHMGKSSSAYRDLGRFKWDPAYWASPLVHINKKKQPRGRYCTYQMRSHLPAGLSRLLGWLASHINIVPKLVYIFLISIFQELKYL